MIDLEELGYAVQCRRTDPTVAQYWETIAAFNSDSVARNYARKCSDSAFDTFAYRVIETETRQQWLDKIEEAREEGIKYGNRQA